MQYTTRPLSDRAWLRAPALRRRSQFSAPWGATLDLLGAELRHLRADHVVIGMDISESEIRNDGLPRASAAPRTPAVEVAFDSKYGPLIYRCDAFTAGVRDRADSWQHNVRSIALTLQSLRAVDRYQASARGEQYTGYRALPSAGNGVSRMDRETAYAVIEELSGMDRSDPDFQSTARRRAKAAAHPDRCGGDRTAWDRLEAAMDVLAAAPV